MRRIYKINEISARKDKANPTYKNTFFSCPCSVTFYKYANYKRRKKVLTSVKKINFVKQKRIRTFAN